MRLARLGAPGAERPVVLAGDGWVDARAVTPDFDERFLGEPDGMTRLAEHAAREAAAGRIHPLGAERVGAPIARPHQILCIGLNYRDHAEETGQAIPAEPILFTKSPNTLVGPHDDIVRPRGAEKLDWEVELGIVVGRRAWCLDSLDEARAAIAGYVLVHDVSERAFQIERGGQWSKGKSAPTFNPAGPFLATPDEFGTGDVPPLDALGLWLDVDGERQQTGTTAEMIFDPATLVHHLSQFLALEPGDLINTGTPPGVGLGQTPPRYLRDGEVVELGIDGLGTQRSRVVPWRR